MLTNNYTKKLLTELTIILIRFQNNLSLREYGRYCTISKDKVRYYYRKFSEGITIKEILLQYETNLSKRGKKITITQNEIEIINSKIELEWSIDIIAGREKRYSKSTLYRRKKELGINVLKTSNKRKKKNIDPNRTIGKIKDMKTIHERDIIFPEVKNTPILGILREIQ